MALCNAVRIVTDKRRHWVTDGASVFTYGRHEESLSVGAVDDQSDAALNAIGEAYLAIHAQPTETIVADVVDAAGLDVGDTATVAGESLRVVGLTYQLEGHGKFRVVPEWSSLLEQRAFDRQRFIDRQRARAGGGFALAATEFGGISTIEGGRLGEIQGFRWSWTDLADVTEDEPWPVWNVEKPCRMYEFLIDAKWWDDEEEEQISIGDSSFGLMVNGVALSPFFLAVLDEEAAEASYQLFGYGFLDVGDRVQPFLAGNGMHENGSLTIRCSERV